MDRIQESLLILNRLYPKEYLDAKDNEPIKPRKYKMIEKSKPIDDPIKTTFSKIKKRYIITHTSDVEFF